MFSFKDQSECTLCVLFIAGLLAILFITLTASGGFDLPQDGGVGGWIYEYQALLSGIITTVVGVSTALIIWKQHNQQRTGKNRYHRARMSDAISELMDYTQGCYRRITDKKAGDSFPEKPVEAMLVFKDSLEYIDDEQSYKAVHELVMFYQVYNARLQSYSFNESGSILEDHIIDTVRLNYFALRIFEYARNTKETISNKKPAYEEMYSSLRALIGIREYLMNSGKYDAEKKIVKKYYQEE